MASPTQQTWVWANSGRGWKTGKPGTLQSIGSQRLGHTLATEQQQWLFLETVVTIGSTLLKVNLAICINIIVFASIILLPGISPKDTIMNTDKDLGRRKFIPVMFIIVQISCSVMSNSLWPHGRQQARLPCPYFLQFKSEFCNKEFMIWATVSSRSCFCWLYRASSSSAAENIINLISVLTIWWCSCVESSFVLLKEGVFYDQYVLFAKVC